MENDSAHELLNYLAKIANQSMTGVIAWAQPNPSTFKWTEKKGDETFLVTIQKATYPKTKQETIGTFGTTFGRHPEQTTYLFQVQDVKTKQTLLSLSSAERPETFKVLSAIFEGAEKGIDRRSTDILKRLLD